MANFLEWNIHLCVSWSGGLSSFLCLYRCYFNMWLLNKTSYLKKSPLALRSCNLHIHCFWSNGPNDQSIISIEWSMKWSTVTIQFLGCKLCRLCFCSTTPTVIRIRMIRHEVKSDPFSPTYILNIQYMSLGQGWILNLNTHQLMAVRYWRLAFSFWFRLSHIILFNHIPNNNKYE